ncbi:PED1A protein, partial [Polypterus senegalus]
MQRSWWNKIARQNEKLLATLTIKFIMADGTEHWALGKVSLRYVLHNVAWKMDTYILEDTHLSLPLLLGLDSITAVKMTIHFHLRKYMMPGSGEHPFVAKVREELHGAYLGFYAAELEACETPDQDIVSNQLDEVKPLLRRWPNVWTEKLGATQGELNFECDQLVEGGKIGGLNNGTAYREVRQFCTAHHLVRFYFLTRIYSTYMESILADFKAGPPPDVVIMNSCVWDVSRYGINSMKEYRMNLEKFFMRLKEILLPECLIIWNLTMPLGKKVYGGFLVPEIQHMEKTLRSDIIEANFYSATLADSHKFDVLDLHYHFRFELQNRMKDGVHWNQLAHRKLTFLLLGHIAEAWNVDLPDNKLERPSWMDICHPPNRYFNNHAMGMMQGMHTFQNIGKDITA